MFLIYYICHDKRDLFVNHKFSVENQIWLQIG